MNTTSPRPAFLSRALAAMSLLILLLAVPSPAAAQSQGDAATGIPTPESVLGFRVGDDFKLASYDQSIEYFRALDAASDRVQMMRVGRTSEGRDWYIAFISSPENLARLEEYREIAQRLAHPDGMTDDEARELARRSKAIVAIDGGLHATETAHAQHTIQLAYDLVTEKEGDEGRAILDNVILLLWPSLNPDGQNMVAEWYAEHLGTPYETARMPELYQKYIGHDNNRDGYALNMIESRVAVRTNRHWEPQVLYSHHQTSSMPATIWLPPYGEPIFPDIHPLMNRMVNLMGTAAAAALDERGLPGAEHKGEVYDAWYPGYIDFINFFHNIVIMFSETGLHGSPTPRYYTVRDFPAADRAMQPGTLHASLWRGGWWRLRDSVDYMLATSISTLDVSAKYKNDILYNRYQAARDVIAAYRENPPYAYVIPQDQRDPVAAVEMLRRLAYQDIEIYQLNAETTIDQQVFAAGTWVIPMDQSGANFAQSMLSIQQYPDLRQYPDGPPDLPYDHAGWTLPYQFGVRTVAVGTPLDAATRGALQSVRVDPVPWDSADADGREPDASPFDSPPGVGFDTNPIAAGLQPPPGSTTGSGPALWVNPGQNNAFRAVNKAWAAGGRVNVADDGSYVITGLGEAALDDLVESLALQARRGDAAGAPIAQTRVGLYRPWTTSIDEGWTRWLLEMYEFGFRSLRNADVRAGSLNDRYDVIILSDMGGRQIINGAATGSVPARYAGGIGRDGVRALDAFVRNGGTLICLDSSSMFAIDELHLPVKNAVADVDRAEFFSSGSIMEVLVDTRHPVMAGMPERASITVTNSPVFTTTEGFRGAALAKYQDAGSPLMSGFLLGPEHLNGYAAALDVKHGDGQVILFGFRPQWRGQPFGTFRALFNAALFSGERAAGATGTEGFWEAPEEPEEPAESEESGEDR
jgi:hypothetical protein